METEDGGAVVFGKLVMGEIGNSAAVQPAVLGGDYRLGRSVETSDRRCSIQMPVRSGSIEP